VGDLRLTRGFRPRGLVGGLETLGGPARGPAGGPSRGVTPAYRSSGEGVFDWWLVRIPVMSAATVFSWAPAPSSVRRKVLRWGTRLWNDDGSATLKPALRMAPDVIKIASLVTQENWYFRKI